jgi:hypothetical protein
MSEAFERWWESPVVLAKGAWDEGAAAMKAKLDAIRKAAEEVAPLLNVPLEAIKMCALKQLFDVAYAQTREDKPKTLCDAHAERMEGKDDNRH